ncbi:MAG: pyridoxamine 5'-phosphate oxidase [Actinomycetota bacterium]|nr:pyridoxamine 5'-phosphate oxidase [Actinomycetota bacterium]
MSIFYSVDLDDLHPNPLQQFQLWFAEAKDSRVVMPEAMALATAAPGGRPSARMVLLKRADAEGFGFHTNLESRKGDDLVANSQAALLFHWQSPGRQVRVEGWVERMSAEEAGAYFRTRPVGSQLAAWASPQSRPLANRAELDRLYREAEARFGGDEVPLPPHWGGFRVVPDTYEFWQHGEQRLHDRVRYTRNGEVWRRQRLAP